MDPENKYDLKFLKKISNNDVNFIKDMILAFKHTAPQIIISMEKQLKNNKYEALGKETHRFIPGVSFLGANNIKDDLIRIENNVNNNINLDDIPGLLENVKKNVIDLIAQFDTDFNLS